MDEGRNEEGKLQLDGTSNLDPILDLPETSPAGTDQVVWRDNEKIGDRRETHQEKAPTVLTNDNFELPTWLQEGMVRENQSHAKIPQYDHWSCASSDAEEDEWDEYEIKDEEPLNGLEPNSDSDPELDTSDLKRDLEEVPSGW
jgi:hypothetical protein